MATNFFKFCLCKNVFISLSLLKDNFARYIILGWFIFFLTSLNVSFDLFSLAWFLRHMTCNSYLCLSVGKLFILPLASRRIFPLTLISCSLKMMSRCAFCCCWFFFFAFLFCFSFCLWVIFLGVWWVSVTLCQSLIRWDFSHLLFQIFYSFLFLLYLAFPLHGHYTFCSCPTVLDCLSNLEILFPALTSITINPTKPVFIFVIVFHLQNLVWFLSYNFHLTVYITYLFLHAIYFIL